MEEDPAMWSLLDLDGGPLLRILSKLTVADLLHVGQSCRALHQLCLENHLWQALLDRDCLLKLKASKHRLQNVYRELCRPSTKYVMRFAALYTNGGVDEQQMIYWADNMFVPNSWGAYCTSRSSNVFCLGLLEVDVIPDTQALAHRQFLESRLLHPAAFLGLHDPNHGPLQANARLAAAGQYITGLSTAMLDRLFMNIYHVYVLGDPVGMTLMHGMHGSPQEIHDTLYRKALEIHRQELLKGRYELDSVPPMDGPEDTPGPTWDKKLLPRLESEGVCRHIAAIHEVTISRAGRFSCPVRCGALYVSVVTSPIPEASTQPAVTFGDWASQPSVTLTDDILSPEQVLELSAAGQLPAVAAWHRTQNWEYMEFQLQRCSSTPHISNDSVISSREHTRPVLHPVLWFRFFTDEEAAHPGGPPVIGSIQPQPPRTVQLGAHSFVELAAPQPSRTDDGSSSTPGQHASQSVVNTSLAMTAHTANQGETSLAFTGACGCSPDTFHRPDLNIHSTEEGSPLHPQVLADHVQGASAKHLPPAGVALSGPDCSVFHAAPVCVVDDLEPHGDRENMHVQLYQPRVGNLVGVKLIAPEDKMAASGWDDHELPNIDMQYITLRGCVVRLADGVTFQ